MAKISVIIPVYNTEKYLRRCLDSVCNQTLSDIEIICINDCSTDNSLEILQEYSAKDERIKVIDFKENKGAAVARNIGIDEAQGEYIGFVDSDDFVDLDFYEKLYNKAIETGADVVKGNVYDYDIKTEQSTLTDFYNINDKIKENKAYFCYGFTSAIYKKDIIKNNNVKFPENISYFEDPYFSILTSILVKNVELVNDAKYNYIRHSSSACSKSKSERSVKDLVLAQKQILALLNTMKLSKIDYCIYTSFLIEQIVPYCSDIAIPEEGNQLAIQTLYEIISQSDFVKAELFITYFLNKRQKIKKRLANEKKELIAKLRKNIKNDL